MMNESFGAVEVKVIVRGDEQRLSRDFIVYNEIISISPDDPILSGLVDKVESDFKGTIEDTQVKINIIWDKERKNV